jgi:hypothetical protein
MNKTFVNVLDGQTVPVSHDISPKNSKIFFWWGKASLTFMDKTMMV